MVACALWDRAEQQTIKQISTAVCQHPYGCCPCHEPIPLLQALGSSVEERPTKTQLAAAVSQALSDAEVGAAGVAAAASRAAVQPLQQQLAALAGELDHVTAQCEVCDA